MHHLTPASKQPQTSHTPQLAAHSATANNASVQQQQQRSPSLSLVLPPSGAQLTPLQGDTSGHVPQPADSPFGGEVGTIDLLAGMLQSPAAAALDDTLRLPLEEVVAKARASVMAPEATPGAGVDMPTGGRSVATGARVSAESSFSFPKLASPPAADVDTQTVATGAGAPALLVASPLQCVDMLAAMVAAQPADAMPAELRSPLEAALAQARKSLAPEGSTPAVGAGGSAHTPANTPAGGVLAARQPSPIVFPADAFAGAGTSTDVAAQAGTPAGGKPAAQQDASMQPAQAERSSGDVSALETRSLSSRPSCLSTGARAASQPKKTVAIASPLATAVDTPPVGTRGGQQGCSDAAPTPQPWQVQRDAGSTPYTGAAQQDGTLEAAQGGADEPPLAPAAIPPQAAVEAGASAWSALNQAVAEAADASGDAVPEAAPLKPSPSPAVAANEVDDAADEMETDQVAAQPADEQLQQQGADVAAGEEVAAEPGADGSSPVQEESNSAAQAAAPVSPAVQAAVAAAARTPAAAAANSPQLPASALLAGWHNVQHIASAIEDAAQGHAPPPVLHEGGELGVPVKGAITQSL